MQLKSAGKPRSHSGQPYRISSQKKSSLLLKLFLLPEQVANQLNNFYASGLFDVVKH